MTNSVSFTHLRSTTLQPSKPTSSDWCKLISLLVCMPDISIKPSRYLFGGRDIQAVQPDHIPARYFETIMKVSILL